MIAKKGFTLSFKFRVGISLYLCGLAATIYHDYLVRCVEQFLWTVFFFIRSLFLPSFSNLRPCPNGLQYCIPRGGLFSVSTSAHYLCELLMWFGFFLMTGTGPNGLFIFSISLANLVPRAARNHEWYLDRFSSWENADTGITGIVTEGNSECENYYESLGRAKLIPFVW